MEEVEARSRQSRACVAYRYDGEYARKGPVPVETDRFPRVRLFRMGGAVLNGLFRKQAAM